MEQKHCIKSLSTNCFEETFRKRRKPFRKQTISGFIRGIKLMILLYNKMKQLKEFSNEGDTVGGQIFKKCFSEVF